MPCASGSPLFAPEGVAFLFFAYCALDLRRRSRFPARRLLNRKLKSGLILPVRVHTTLRLGLALGFCRDRKEENREVREDVHWIFAQQTIFGSLTVHPKVYITHCRLSKTTRIFLIRIFNALISMVGVESFFCIEISKQTTFLASLAHMLQIIMMYHVPRVPTPSYSIRAPPYLPHAGLSEAPRVQRGGKIFLPNNPPVWKIWIFRRKIPLRVVGGRRVDQPHFWVGCGREK